MKKRDYIFIILVLVFCAVVFFLKNINNTTGESVCIYVDSKLYKKLSLNKNTQVNIDDKNTLIIDDGYAYMKEATCPDKLCIKQGKISNSNNMIVCLPNKVVVKMEKQSDVDILAK